MRILLATSEAHPYSKTGGLADMTGALAKSLARAGHKVGLVTPLYAGLRERFPGMEKLDFFLEVPLGVERIGGEIWTLNPCRGLTIYFVDQPEFYQRSTLYQKDGQDYPDNAERFIFFAKAASELALHLPWKPEILHAHDWQAAVAMLLLRHHRMANPGKPAPAACLTIHNLAYQGVFSASQFALTNLPWDYFAPDGVEFYGRLNCLKAGIACAERITTVSPRYAREIATEEFGAGLDGLLRHRQHLLTGILNGVDYGEWDPASDPSIKQCFTHRTLRAKGANKAALQSELGLEIREDVPLFGNIGRMVEQKGVDILLSAIEEMLPQHLQFVVLGSGEPGFQNAFQALASRFPAKCAVRIGFDEGLSHRVEAGCDFFVMPSRFEPCGLNQMYSQRYGTVPLVRAVGGLDDSVIDPREDSKNATGIKFHEYSPAALAKAMLKGLALYRNADLFRRFQSNGMRSDFSWEKTAGMYEKVYREAIQTKA